MINTYLVWMSFLLFSIGLYGQVGIGTLTPESTLDVRAINHNGAVSATDGVLVPRVNDLATAGGQDGQLVYLIADDGDFSKGFYFWNGNDWEPFTQKSSSSVVESIVEPDVLISGTPTAPVAFSYAIVRAIPDPGSINIPVAVSGISGATALVTMTLTISHGYDEDIEVYLSSPTGQILCLTDGNGGSGDNYTNTRFTDAAPINITTGSPPFTGDFNPQGEGYGNIMTLAGFNGHNPNGQWTVTVTDDDAIISGTLDSFTLSISGSTPSNWISLGEVSVDYFDDTAIIVQSTYSGDPLDLSGVKTALTRSTSSVPAGTSATALPGVVLNYASASPGAIGDFWVNTYNQARNVGLTNNATYYFQLWRHGNIETPVNSNESFSIVPMRIPQ